jgi:hypothetical protein
MNNADKSILWRILFALGWGATSLILWLAAATPSFSMWYLIPFLFLIASWIVLKIREKLLEALTGQAIRFSTPMILAYIVAAIVVAAIYYFFTILGQFLATIIGHTPTYIWNFIQYMIAFKLIISLWEENVFSRYTSRLGIWGKWNILGTAVCAVLWGYYAYHTIQLTPALTGWWFTLYSPVNFTGIFWILAGLLLQGFFEGLGITYLSFKAKEFVPDESIQAWQRPRNLGRL